MSTTATSSSSQGPVITKSKVTQFKSSVRQRIQEKHQLRKQQERNAQQHSEQSQSLKRQRSRDAEDDDDDDENSEDEELEVSAALREAGARDAKKAKRSSPAADDSDDANDSDDSDDDDDEYDARQVQAALMATRAGIALTDDDIDALAGSAGQYGHDDEDDDDDDVDDEDENTTLVVSNLPSSFVNPRDIRSYFNQITPVQRMEVDADKNIAYVQVLTRETAELIVQELDYMLVDDRCVRLKICDMDDLKEQEKKIWQPLMEKRGTQRYKNRLTSHLRECSSFLLPGPHQLTDTGKLRERELNLERHYMRVNQVRNKESIMQMMNDVKERQEEERQKWQALGIQYDFAGI